MARNCEKINRTNAPETCIFCGAKLLKAGWKRNGEDRLGYNGTGFFCSVRCGFWFADVFARAGYRLSPWRDPDPPKY